MPIRTAIYTALVLAIGAVAGAPASAALLFDQNVTNDVIFNSGNGSFTVNQNNGIELGLRGKLRFDSNNLPQAIYNSNGDGTYSFRVGRAPHGYSWQPDSPTTPVWSFEWSVNSNFNGTGTNLGAYTYEIGIDFDPGPGTNFLIFDPITPSGSLFFDNAYGNNSTPARNGTVPTTLAEARTLISTKNLAQNSWNMEFFNNTPFDIFNPNVAGAYDFYLVAFDSTGQQLARSDITIITVPEPATLALFGFGLIGLGLLGWFRRRRMMTAAAA